MIKRDFSPLFTFAYNQHAIISLVLYSPTKCLQMKLIYTSLTQITVSMQDSLAVCSVTIETLWLGKILLCIVTFVKRNSDNPENKKKKRFVLICSLHSLLSAIYKNYGQVQEVKNIFFLDASLHVYFLCSNLVFYNQILKHFT